jgi:hypothetical protein
MLAALAITRRRGPHQQVGTTGWAGLDGHPAAGAGSASALALLAWVRPLLLFWGGVRVFTVGGVSLLMAMSRERQGDIPGAVVGHPTGLAVPGLPPAALRSGLALTGGFTGAYARCSGWRRWVPWGASHCCGGSTWRVCGGRQAVDAVEALAGAD